VEMGVEDGESRHGHGLLSDVGVPSVYPAAGRVQPLGTGVRPPARPPLVPCHITATYRNLI
jgi:hypothetical protein